MPLDAKAAKELKTQIGMARKMPLNFGLALGKKPEDTALNLHRKREGSLLFKQARKEPGVEPAKSCHGVMTVEANVMTFDCELDPPAGMKKKCRAFLTANKISLKVRILLPDGGEFEAGEDDEAEAVAGGSDGGDGGGEDPSGEGLSDAPEDDLREKWERAKAQVQAQLVDVLKAGKGDLSKIRAVWALATEKADGGNFTAGLQALAALRQLFEAAGAQTRTEAERGSGHVVGDTLDGKELLQELKDKGDQIKAALEAMPKRVAEGRQMIAEVTQGVKDLDLPFARVAMTRIDMLLRDAEPVLKARADYQTAEGRLASRARAMGDLQPDSPVLGPLLGPYRAAMEACMSAATDLEWLKARELLPAWIKALGDLEKAYQGQFDDETKYRQVEAELSPRAEAIKDLPPEAPGLGDVVRDYQAAAVAVLDLADKLDWTAALAKVPEWRAQLERAEVAHRLYHQNREAFHAIYDPAQGDLARAMKMGAVNPAMGVLIDRVKQQAPLAKAAADGLDYENGIAVARELETRLAALIEARETYVAQKAEWAAKFGAISSKIAAVEGCGPLDATLDGLKATFDAAVLEARDFAGEHDYAAALGKLDDIVARADAFLEAKAVFDEARADVFEEAREDGRGDIADVPTDGRDNGATITGIEAAMEDSNSLKTSKGLQALLEEARLIDKTFAEVLKSADPALGQNFMRTVQTGIENCGKYQRDHKEDARSKSDREKFAQAEALAVHYRAIVAELVEANDVLTKLAAIDPAALVGDEAGAMKALGQIDRIKGQPLSKAAQDLAEHKRRELAALLMKAAPTPNKVREVAVMMGGDFLESYERQTAMGPLVKTASESRTRRDHESTRIQPAGDAEHVDQTRRLAQRLITEDGRLELAALYACDPEDLGGDSPASRQTARALKRLRENPDAIEVLESIPAPKDAPAQAMVRATLGLPAGTAVTEEHAREAALASLMAELRQKDVGSCFATQVAINIHDTDPKRYLQDISDMMANGAITREVDGRTITMPVETIMSQKALETSKIKLSRADNPILLGSSSGGALDPAEKTRLEEAPAFQAAFEVLGVGPDDREAAMAGALRAMQGSDEFLKNQNEKALRKAVATIADADKREKVFKRAYDLLSAVGDDVKVALEQAMAAEGVPDADAGNQAAAADAAKAAFDTLAAAGDFEVEPALVVRQIVMDKVGLTQADLDKQKEYEAAAAALAKDTRPDSHPDRHRDINQLQQLQDACADIRPKILQMEQLQTACADVYTGGEDNRLLRAYEYTLTALAEEASAMRKFPRVQNLEKNIVGQVMTAAAAELKADPAITLSDPDIDTIRTTLFDAYKTLFDEGTKHAYSADIQAATVSADGSSSRGGYYLYDIRGIASPADWIQIDDQIKYAACVRGNMMLACKQEYDDNSAADEQTRQTARFLAEKLADQIGGQAFADKAKGDLDAAATAVGKKGYLPWQIPAGGFSEDVISIVEERTPTKTSMGTPANSEDLMRKVGAQLKGLWDADASLRDAADEDGESATVNAGNRGVHAFSLMPAEDPRMRAILESGDVNAAIDGFKADEEAKWDSALTSIPLATRDEVKTFMVQMRMPSRDDWVDHVWGRLEAGTDPRNAKGVIAACRSRVAPAQHERFDQAIGGNVVRAVIPPVQPAELQAKLEKVAAKLDVPEDLVAAVTDRAKTALDAKDATQATMADIKDELVRAMTAEGMDASSVSQSKVNDGLREPAGLIFADSNWGNAEHRVKYAMVVNPVSGEMEMWRMNEDGSRASKLDDAKWVKKEWTTIT